MCADNLERCFEFLHALAMASRQDSTVAVDMWPIGDALGFTAELTQSISRQLLDRRMLDPTPVAGRVRVSPIGLGAIALAEADPDRPSIHFPALATFFELGDDLGEAFGKHSMSVLLDQLTDCHGVLVSGAPAAARLEQRLCELEQLVGDSRVETTSLRRGLQRLRESLPD